MNTATTLDTTREPRYVSVFLGTPQTPCIKKLAKSKTQYQFLSKWAELSGHQYKHDVWPEHFSRQQCVYYDNYYKAMPEEFYTKTQLPVMTPFNVSQFLSLTSYWELHRRTAPY